MGVNLGPGQGLKFPWDPMMTGVVATAAVIIVGVAASILFPSSSLNNAPVLWETMFKKRRGESK